MLNKFVFAFVLGVLVSISGCATNRATATLTPGTDLNKVKTYYVVERPDDTRGVGLLIRTNLAKRGLSATAGPASKSPADNADAAVLTYADRWMWDITMYLVELTIAFRNPATNFPMAVGSSYHTSLTRKSPEEMVDEVLSNIFNKAQPKN